ncbi:hypothetical protein IGI04_012172 [Brassica rapa subsp. trilocularis]|uniref:Reverse transcriptase zinc-binding domain-containing protein n=2 Tax=Brassica campestris TaxID=3711 RepID=A0ABQ7N565_BRACM|nr:hypothetical protein IGI04_012172 [Brassica rapa subsp. trilocularis]
MENLCITCLDTAHLGKAARLSRKQMRDSKRIGSELRLRPLVYNWIRIEVGNGRMTRFWNDNWSPYGKLSEFLNLPQRSRLGIQETATLDDLYRDGVWSLPAARSEQQVLLQVYLTSLSLNSLDDRYIWSLNSSTQEFSTGLVYGELKHHNQPTQWHKAVWSPRGIPRQKFLAWLLVQNRCPTRDWLLGWGLPTDPLCLLCNVAPESRDHIYYQCPYSWSVWTRIANRAGHRPDQDWNREMINMQNLQGPRHLKIIRLLAWQCMLYYIWAERNSRLHRHIFKPPDSIVKQIEATIRSKISALRDQSPRLSSSICCVERITQLLLSSTALGWALLLLVGSPLCVII